MAQLTEEHNREHFSGECANPVRPPLFSFFLLIYREGILGCTFLFTDSISAACDSCVVWRHRLKERGRTMHEECWRW